MYPVYPSSGWSGCSILPWHSWSSSDNCHSVRKVSHLGTWRTGRRITLIVSTENVTILFRMEGGGLGATDLAFWYLQLGEMVFVSSCISTMLKWCLSSHYGEMVFDSYWISTYWYISWEIADWTRDRSGDLNGDLLEVFSLVLCSIPLFRRSGAQ